MKLEFSQFDDADFDLVRLRLSIGLMLEGAFDRHSLDMVRTFNHELYTTTAGEDPATRLKRQLLAKAGGDVFREIIPKLEHIYREMTKLLSMVPAHMMHPDFVREARELVSFARETLTLMKSGEALLNPSDLFGG